MKEVNLNNMAVSRLNSLNSLFFDGLALTQIYTKLVKPCKKYKEIERGRPSIEDNQTTDENNEL